MFTTRSLVMLAAALITAARLGAVAITTNCYEETASFFIWGFTWDGSATTGAQTFSPQNAALTACVAGGVGVAMPALWEVSVTPDFFTDIGMAPTQEMTFKAQHKTAVHPPFEAPEGDPFSKSISSVSPGLLGVTNTFQTIFFDTDTRHNNAPVPHFDIYSAQYRRPALEQTIVQFSGEHVPEPSTFTLLGLALAAIGGYRRRRRLSCGE